MQACKDHSSSLQTQSGEICPKVLSELWSSTATGAEIRLPPKGLREAKPGSPNRDKEFNKMCWVQAPAHALSLLSRFLAERLNSQHRRTQTHTSLPLRFYRFLCSFAYTVLFSLFPLVFLSSLIATTGIFMQIT